MLCDICKKTEATVHLTQIDGVDGKMLKVDLCESCAKEKGVQESAAFSVANLLAGLGAGEGSRVEAAGAQCPVCGFTQADFKKTGRLGCSGCWEAFATSLGPLLRAMHKGEHHVGKVPARAAHTQAVSSQMQELTEQLEKAVREEKYEDAAHIRDQIRELEAKWKKPAGTTRSAE